MKRWIWPLAVVLLVGGVLVASPLLGWNGPLGILSGLAGGRAILATAKKPATEPPQSSGRPAERWDGQIALDDAQIAALGIEVFRAEAQTRPTYLDVNGATAYNPSTLTPVRPRFNSLVSKVYVQVGDSVRKGDPLLDLFSTDLAEAKSKYEERLAQWEHDSAQLARLEPLYKQKAISEKDYFDAFNDERKSQLEYKVARDNLIVYGLTDEQIHGLRTEESSRKAQMTLHAPIDGLVLTRDVVEGSLYDNNDVLIVIAPHDKLWVLGNVYESDQDKVHVGQPWEVRFPFLSDVLHTTVEHVDVRVNPTTKTVLIRTSITNPEGRFKADMLVRGKVAIPPSSGRMVIPRQAVIVQEGGAHVFVRDPENPRRFLRKEVQMVQEEHVDVIVEQGPKPDGLKPGDQIVGRGSLLLSQMYEDLSIAATGMPL